MPLYYLNPADEPRECPCKRAREWNPQGIADARCVNCGGTSRLGDENKRPELLVFGNEYDGFNCIWADPQRGPVAQYLLGRGPTEAAALEAARRNTKS